MTTLTVVTFEPETIGVYIDGKLHERGETYMEGRILRNIMEGDKNIDNTETIHTYPDRWNGMPKTLEELEDMYETDT